MWEIVASIKKPKNIISVDDCLFNLKKIYACKMDNEIRVLVKFAGRYHWSNLELSSKGNKGGYTTAKEAVKDWLSVYKDKSVYVFNNQCELKKWAN